MHSFAPMILTALTWGAHALATPLTGSLAPLPADIPNGGYFGMLNEDGTTTWKSIDDGGATNVTVARRALQPRLSNGVHCGTLHADPTDRRQAASIMSDKCGDGLKYTSRAIAFTYNSVVAYGCNYVSSTTCSSDEVERDFGKITGTCDLDKSAYYHEGGYSVGWTPYGTGYC